jgi:phosphoglycerate dehydrogenase-like enzyme
MLRLKEFTIGLVEHAIAMMFALVRRIPTHLRDKDQHQFKRHLPYATKLPDQQPVS